MTKDEALFLVREYSERLLKPVPEDLPDYQVRVLENAQGMYSRFPGDGSKNKAMRWLGYIQGVLVACNIYTLDEVKEHSRRKWVSSVI